MMWLAIGIPTDISNLNTATAGVEACFLIRRLPIGDGAVPLPKRGFVYFELGGQPGEQPAEFVEERKFAVDSRYSSLTHMYEL